MNTARQVISRRFVSGLGPRLTVPSRYASTAAPHHSGSPQDRRFMNSVFLVGIVGTAGLVAFGASRSGGRMNNRYTKKNATLDNSKWFAEGSDVNHVFGTKH